MSTIMLPVARRRQTRAYGGRHGSSMSVAQRAPALYVASSTARFSTAGDTRRHADDHARMREAALRDPLDEMPEHLLG